MVRQQTSNAHCYHRPLHSGVVVVQATTLDVCEEMAIVPEEVITSEQEVANTHVHSNLNNQGHWVINNVWGAAMRAKPN